MSKGAGGGRPKGRGEPPSWVALARASHDAGQSYRSIGRALGLDAQTVRRWVDPAAGAKFLEYHRRTYYPEHRGEISSRVVSNTRRRNAK